MGFEVSSVDAYTQTNEKTETYFFSGVRFCQLDRCKKKEYFDE